MSQIVTIFNPTNRPVLYSQQGLKVGYLATVEADLDDPVCAKAVERGRIVVLTPRVVDTAVVPVAEPVVVTNSEPVVGDSNSTLSDVEGQTSANETEEVEQPADEIVEFTSKSQKPKKSTSQASKES